MEQEALMDLPDDTTSSLYPALFQCFAIILCGYLAGFLNIISQHDAKGLGSFVGMFALPSLIFLSLAKLDFSIVNWTFLGAILLAKGVIFFGVIIVTLIISRPINLGRAGIFAIFSTQSNDFALGYPIIHAIYGTTHPEYAQYLYLMAPISLAILNPVAFVLMEVHKQRETTQNQNLCKLKLMRQVVKGIAFNPAVIMTVFGIIANVSFHHTLPIYIEGLLEVVGQSFSATALFILGIRMVGQIQRLRGPALLLPCVLIMIKLIVLPVVMRESVSALDAGVNDSDTTSLSTYAFMYGTIPTAPAVFVFSNLYQLEIDLMASSMVVCTFLSAPIMFMSAQMISIINDDYASQIKRFGYDISIASLVAVLWVTLVFILTKKFKRMPHQLSLCLMVSQMILAIGVICGGPVLGSVQPKGFMMFQQSLCIFGLLSCSLWTSMLSVGLLMLECRGSSFISDIWPVLSLVAWGMPVAIVAILLIVEGADIDLNGRTVNTIRLFILVFSLTVCAGCLIYYMRLRRRSARFASLSADVATGSGPQGDTAGLIDNAETGEMNEETPRRSSNGGCNGCCTNDPNCQNSNVESPTQEIEDIAIRCACPSSQQSRCPSRQHGVCRYIVELDAANSLGILGENSRGRGWQLLAHAILLITFCLGMFIGIAYTTWTMMMKEQNGIYFEIEFLDIAANYGQGLIMLILFGLNPDEIIIPAVKFVKSKWFGDTLVLPAVEDLGFETKLVCQQFTTHHLDRCKGAIAKDTKWRMRTYKDVFRGSCLVRWLVNCGLAKDDAEAVHYGRHLLDGRVICHINNAHHFTNSPLLYLFK